MVDSSWYTVEQRGFDSSGRPNRATRYMWAVVDAIKEHPLIAPFAHKIVVVQNGFMGSGGASASDGFHSLAQCIDFRTWNLSDDEIDKLVWVSRLYALGLWRRDTTWRHGGMAEHAHGPLGGDHPQSPGSAISWHSYITGGDGLSGTGGDYERRPSPLVLVPPRWIFEESWMSDEAVKAAIAEIRKDVNGLVQDFKVFRGNEVARDKEAAKKAKAFAARIVGEIGGVADTLTELEQLVQGESQEVKDVARRARDQILAVLSADPDVDGADDPAVREP